MLTHTEKVNTFLSLREARGRLCRYMSGIGYEIIGTDADILFERGNALGRIPGSPPRAWPLRVFAHIGPGKNGSEIILRWEIPSSGRILSIWDVRYLRQEVKGAVQTVAARQVNLNQLEATHTSTAILTLGVYLVLFLTLTVPAVLAATGDIPFAWWFLSLFIVGTLLLVIRAPLASGAKGRSA